MTHIVAGYPDKEECKKIALMMAKSGVSFIEMQIPFSDPVVDGKTILDANMKALQDGITPDDCFDLMRDIKKQVKIPLLFMTYFNVPFRYGLKKFCEKAREAGCYGLIIPDMPIDEEKYEHYLELCKKYDLKAIQIISPITPVRRLKKIAKVAEGFVYCVSRFSTTGESAQFNQNLVAYLNKVRKYIKIPIALGFGISNKMQIEIAKKYSDIIVIGSKILNIYNQSKNGAGIVKVKDFLLKNLTKPIYCNITNYL